MQKIITHINFAKGFRGGERQTLLLIKELSHRGYKQKVFTRVESELANRLQDVNELEIIRISKPYIFNISKVESSSLIHAHETKGAQFAYYVNLFYKIPYIITRRVDNPVKNNFFNRLIYEKANYTAVLSHAIQAEVQKVSQNVNFKTIPSASSELSYNEKEVENLKQRFKDKFLIGNIGELDNTHKGQYYLIEAMKMIEKEYPDIHLIFLGKGKDEQNYKEQSKDLKNITFEGFVDNVGDYLKCLDLFVFPSLNEGLGSILLDVIKFEVPIVASNVGGIPEIISDDVNGILFKTKDSHAIYRAILKLYKEKDLATTYIQNGLKILDKFSVETMTTSYEKCYKDILK